MGMFPGLPGQAKAFLQEAWAEKMRLPSGETMFAHEERY